jgi:hypothetical protein
MNVNVTAHAPTKAGKGCGMAFFGVFALAGIFALIGLTKTLWDGARSRFWTPASATIVRSEIKPENGDYIVDLEYRYDFKGKIHTGTRLRPDKNTFETEREAQRAQQRYRVDRKVTCYVNASNPEESCLELASPFQFLFLLIPVIFIVVGVGGIAMMRRADKPKAISERHRQGGSGALALRIFGAIFMLVGGGLTYGLGILPWLEARAAADWKEVPCTITSSRVEARRGSKGSTSYSLEIQYDYVVDGQVYTSDRYNFAAASSGSRKWRDEVAAAYREGRQTVCYVNPAEPSEAVLIRESGTSWFVAIPAVFFVAGLLIFANAGRVAGPRRAVRNPITGAPGTGSIGGLRGNVGETGGPVSLTPAGSTLATFLILLVVAVFWNGVVFGVLFLAETPGPVKAFLAIFGLIGLGLAAAVVHQFLSLFNPRPSVQATAGSVRLGESLEVRFSFSGRTQRITQLKITLKAEEVATYRRGTDTRTDRHVFHLTTLLETRDSAVMQSGSVTLTIPGTSMHSFDAPNNKIVWKLELHGEIPRWPDVKLEFPIVVLPHLIP